MPLPIRISLAAARVNAKMTQRELANKMDVSVNTIISWEKGKVIPNKAQLHLFCDICNILGQ